jgi:hypothetical protein
MKKLLSLFLIGSMITGCATSSQNIPTSYVSSVQYDSYTCRQISEEMISVQNQVTQLGGHLDTAASHDKMITGAGILLFWPALFFLGGNKEQEAEYGKLKGQYQALQHEYVAKNCTQK